MEAREFARMGHCAGDCGKPGDGGARRSSRRLIPGRKNLKSLFRFGENGGGNRYFRGGCVKRPYAAFAIPRCCNALLKGIQTPRRNNRKFLSPCTTRGCPTAPAPAPEKSW